MLCRIKSSTKGGGNLYKSIQSGFSTNSSNTPRMSMREPWKIVVHVLVCNTNVTVTKIRDNHGRNPIKFTLNALSMGMLSTNVGKELEFMSSFNAKLIKEQDGSKEKRCAIVEGKNADGSRATGNSKKQEVKIWSNPKPQENMLW